MRWVWLVVAPLIVVWLWAVEVGWWLPAVGSFVLLLAIGWWWEREHGDVI